MKKILLLGLTMGMLHADISAQSNLIKEQGLTYSLPAAFTDNTGAVVLAWTEKDAQDKVSFVYARSTDGGKSFGEKKLIYAAPGIGTGRLARPRLLFKKNGDMVAVFSMNPHAQLNTGGEKPSRPRESQIHFTVSKDGGNTWSQPQPIHTDLTPNTIRGFFDATIMANDELAVVFLKDIPGQKHQRDLRIVTTVNGVPQDERVIDPFVCDCCNLGLLTDAEGNLHVYYRENQDDLRDIAKMVSKDNGQTFSGQSWVHRDNWIVRACPHNGPQAIRHGNTNLIVYYSGKEDESGIRLVNQNGNLLDKITDETVRYATLVGDNQKAVVLYTKGNKETGTKIAYKAINNQKVAKEKMAKHAENSANPNGVFVGKKLLLTYELTEDGKSVGIKTELINL